MKYIINIALLLLNTFFLYSQSNLETILKNNGWHFYEYYTGARTYLRFQEGNICTLTYTSDEGVRDEVVNETYTISNNKVMISQRNISMEFSLYNNGEEEVPIDPRDGVFILGRYILVSKERIIESLENISPIRARTYKGISIISRPSSINSNYAEIQSRVYIREFPSTSSRYHLFHLYNSTQLSPFLIDFGSDYTHVMPVARTIKLDTIGDQIGYWFLCEFEPPNTGMNGRGDDYFIGTDIYHVKAIGTDRYAPIRGWIFGPVLSELQLF